MRVSRSLFAIVVLFLLIACGGWYGWNALHHHEDATNVPPMVVQDGDTLRVQAHSPLQKRLTVENVILSSSPHHLDLPAQIIPAPGRSININTPVSGRVAEIRVQPGQTVQKGDILAILYSGDLAQAWSDQRKAQSALTLARTAYRRASAVLSAGGNAVKDMQSARNDLEQAKAEANRAQERLQALGANNAEGYQPVIAPFAGTIGSLSVGVGQNITDPTTALMTLVDTREVWISASVPEDILPELSSTMALTAPFEGQTCSGPITSRDPILHTDTRRLNVYLRCANTQGLLRPGQFTTASLSVPSRMHLLLPKTALLMNNDQVSVFVEAAPNVYRRRIIDIRYDEGDNVSVRSGLTDHDRIITHGAILLNDN